MASHDCLDAKPHLFASHLLPLVQTWVCPPKTKNESTEDRAQDPQAEAKMVAKKVKTEGKLRCLSTTAAQKQKDSAEKQKADDKQTAQELANKLRAAPSFVRKFYDGKFKLAKMSNPDKKEFVAEVLNTSDWKSEFFERIQKFEVRDEEKDTDTWMSWREVVNLDGEALVLAQLAQKTMTKRAHPKLDPLHVTTLAMPENERFQYKQGKNQEIHTNAEMNEHARSCKEEPPVNEQGKPNTDDIEKEKKILMGIKKVHNGVLASAIEVKIKLGKYQDNKYFMRVFNNSQCIPNY